MIFVLVIRVVCLCLLLAAAETLHGIARTVFIVPRLGNRKARQLSLFSGTLLAFILCYFYVPGLGIHDQGTLLLLGLTLSLFMAGFDITIARLVMRSRWDAVWNDFHPAKGNWLIFGLLALLFIPWIVMRLKGPL